jgi:alkylation response protein AidB-like acyl-CoA dehydrogenase
MQIPREDILEHAQLLRKELLEPNAWRWEKKQRQPIEDLRTAIGKGFGGLDLDPEDGGSGISFTQKLQVCEEPAKGCFPFAFSLINTGNIAVKMAQSKSPEHHKHITPLINGEIFGATALTEPGAGSASSRFIRLRMTNWTSSNSNSKSETATTMVAITSRISG